MNIDKDEITVDQMYSLITDNVDSINGKHLKSNISLRPVSLGLSQRQGIAYYKNFINKLQHHQFTKNVSNWKKSRNRLFTPNGLTQIPNNTINSFYQNKYNSHYRQSIRYSSMMIDN